MDYFEGLQELAKSAFPKKCASCGRIFDSAEQFLSETQFINEEKSGLKQSLDDNDSVIVELYRNCPCGSTLMDYFNDRRDISKAGLERRKRFDELLGYLVNEGLEYSLVREELLKVFHGQKSEILMQYKLPIK